MPSVVLHVVEYTFSRGFESFRAHHVCRHLTGFAIHLQSVKRQTHNFAVCLAMHDDFGDGGCKHWRNLVVMANTSLGNVLAHGIGHAFQLWHVVGKDYIHNLMYSPLADPRCRQQPLPEGCSLASPEGDLKPDQEKTVNGSIVSLEP